MSLLIFDDRNSTISFSIQPAWIQGGTSPDFDGTSTWATNPGASFTFQFTGLYILHASPPKIDYNFFSVSRRERLRFWAHTIRIWFADCIALMGETHNLSRRFHQWASNSSFNNYSSTVLGSREMSNIHSLWPQSWWPTLYIMWTTLKCRLLRQSRKRWLQEILSRLRLQNGLIYLGSIQVPFKYLRLQKLLT